MHMNAGVLAGLLVLAGGLIPARGQNAPANATAPTFNRDVAPILFKQCAGCHRPGEAAPMSLLTYEDARPRARAIARAVANKTMPPWHADAPAGTFHNERILTDAERQSLIRWADTGSLRGDARDRPQTPTFAKGWTLGTPDVVLEMPEDYSIPASGSIEYEHFYTPTGFAEPTWVKSLEIYPGNRAAVHHVLVYHVTKPLPGAMTIARPNPRDIVYPRQRAQGSRQRRPLEPGQVRRLLATYAPGTNPQDAPDGMAFLLEPGGMLEFQMHYTTNGTAGTDRTRVGIVFSKEPAPREILAQAYHNATLRLPPGSSDTSVSTDLEFLENATVWGIFPHTHLRGKRWEYQLVGPDGSSRPVLSVPRYDFNWQTFYMFKEPLQVAKGSKLVSTAWYDNSRANRFNPDPDKEVLWGDQTWEEMQYTGVLVSLQ